MCPCGWLVHVVSLCLIDNISECFPSTKDFGEISPSHVEPAIIVCVCFPFLKAFMLCSVLLEVSMIPLPPFSMWILDQCYWFNRFAVKCRSYMDLNQRVFSCLLFHPQWPGFIDRLTDKGSVIACRIPNVCFPCCGLQKRVRSSTSALESFWLKLTENGQKLTMEIFKTHVWFWAPDAVMEPERILSSCPQGPASSLTSDVPSTETKYGKITCCCAVSFHSSHQPLLGAGDSFSKCKNGPLSP